MRQGSSRRRASGEACRRSGQRRAPRVWTAALLGVALAAPGIAMAAAAAPPGVIEFAGELHQKHAYLLAEPQRHTLDEINRQLREAQQHRRSAKNDAARQEADGKLAAAADRLVKLLEECPQVKRVALQDNTVQPPIRGPFELPSDAGALLFRIESARGANRFVNMDLNQSRPEHSGTITIDCEPAGVTWALVAFNTMPVKRVTFPVELKRKGSDPVRTLMDVITPETGRFALTVLSDDTGQPAPAMVRITAKASGRDRRPSNAADFSLQFDGNGRPNANRRANLPGRLGGNWWCVPDPFDMTLPPGTYELAVRRGAEHVPVFDTFTVETGRLVSKTCRPKRWVDMRHLGWYSGDDHVHGQILSDADADRLMAWIQAEDLHLANIVKMGDVFRTWFEQRGWGPEYRVIDGDYVLSPGQECPRTHQQIGHTLAMNTTSMVRDTDKYFLYDWVADTVRAQGGLWGYAHVCSKMFFVHRDMSINVPKNKADFVELMQFARLGTELYYDFLNTGFKLTAAAGSDVPWGGTVGEVRVYVFIGDEPFSADAWFEAVRQGRTFVTNGPMLELRVDDALPGDEITVDENRKLRVHARAWGHPEWSRPTKLEIVRQGEVIRSAEPTAASGSEIAVEFEVDAGDGFWIAARTQTSDGMRAHTTPVYVVRKGLRFWKFASVDELIAKRLDSLKQVENLVADARRKYEAGELEGDQTLQLLAKQGPELLKRVEAARSIYQELERTAERERAIRSASGR